MTEIIRREIALSGPVSCARFMELALYHPELGYYERAGDRIGRSGDFFTSVSVGSLFGELLAFQFTEWIESDPQLSSVPRVYLAEAGVHDGRLAADILGGLQAFHPELFERLTYRIIEPSPRRRDWQRERLAAFGERVEWLESPGEVPEGGIAGIVFANELLDAFPAHRVGWDARARAWFEWRVDWVVGRLAWMRHPIVPGEELSSMVAGVLGFLDDGLLAVLPDGFTTELCPAADAWWSRAAATLRTGWLLTLDYGLLAEEFFQPARQGGTLRAFQKQHQVADLLADPGEKDLTTDVNFTRLQLAGEAAGLRTDFLASQGKFLTGVLQRTMAGPECFPAWTPARTRQFQTLTHPEHLGRAFRVLVQRKLCS